MLTTGRATGIYINERLPDVERTSGSYCVQVCFSWVNEYVLSVVPELSTLI